MCLYILLKCTQFILFQSLTCAFIMLCVIFLLIFQHCTHSEFTYIMYYKNHNVNYFFIPVNGSFTFNRNVLLFTKHPKEFLIIKKMHTLSNLVLTKSNLQRSVNCLLWVKQNVNSLNTATNHMPVCIPHRHLSHGLTLAENNFVKNDSQLNSSYIRYGS